MSRWLRFYDDALNDRKVQSLPAVLFKAWVNILCLASKRDGKPFSTQDVAFALRISEQKAQGIIVELTDRRLLDDTAQGLVPHNWGGRQFQSDDSKQRVRDHRNRKKEADCNGDVTATVTPPEQSRTDTEQNRKKEVAANAAPPPKRSQGFSLPSDWRPADTDYDYGLNLGLNLSDIAAAEEEMRLWATGNANRSIARKSNWQSTFRAWMRRNAQRAKRNGPTENLSTVARRLARDGISFGPKPSLNPSGPPTLRLLSKG